MASKRETGANLKHAPESAIRSAASSALINALKPLSKLALEAGLSIEDVYQLLRFAAVKQQFDSAVAESTVPSISGIAAATGIPRAEVSKLLKRAEPRPTRTRINDQITNTVLVAWRQDPRFTTESGQPAALAMYGRGRTFERLAEIHGRGIPTRALLEELRRTNSISVGQDQSVQQNAGVAVERGVTAVGIRTLGLRVADLVDTMLHNIKSSGDARLVSSVSKKVPSEQLPLLRREVTKMTEHYLGEMREVLSRYSTPRRESQGGTTLNVTAFCSEYVVEKQSLVKSKRRKNYRRAT